MKAVKCPVCNGSGKCQVEPCGDSTSMPTIRECHGCNGQGWVTIYEWIYPPCNPCHFPSIWDTHTTTIPIYKTTSTVGDSLTYYNAKTIT
jgi:DnaJ-class molecular chaperone